MCEKNDEVGGILIGEQAISFKYEMYQLGVTLGKLCEEAGVDIRLNAEVTKEYADQIAADVMILAVGSEPMLPPIPGLDSEHVVLINDYHHHQDQITDNVIVLGGGLAGCEAAIHFAREGKKVRLIEMNAELSPDANVRHRPLLMAEIEKSGIQVYRQHKALEVISDGVVCEDSSGQQVLIPGSSVICALGQRSRRAVVDELWNSAPLVSQIGDCVKVSTITTAVYQGHHAALDV